MQAERSAETTRLMQAYNDYLMSGATDLKKLTELHQAALASAQRDYEASQEAVQQNPDPAPQ